MKTSAIKPNQVFLLFVSLLFSCSLVYSQREKGPNLSAIDTIYVFQDEETILFPVELQKEGIDVKWKILIKNKTLDLNNKTLMLALADEYIEPEVIKKEISLKKGKAIEKIYADTVIARKIPVKEVDIPTIEIKKELKKSTLVLKKGKLGWPSDEINGICYEYKGLLKCRYICIKFFPCNIYSGNSAITKVCANDLLTLSLKFCKCCRCFNCCEICCYCKFCCACDLHGNCFEKWWPLYTTYIWYKVKDGIKTHIDTTHIPKLSFNINGNDNGTTYYCIIIKKRVWPCSYNNRDTVKVTELSIKQPANLSTAAILVSPSMPVCPGTAVTATLSGGNWSELGDLKWKHGTPDVQFETSKVQVNYTASANEQLQVCSNTCLTTPSCASTSITVKQPPVLGTVCPPGSPCSIATPSSSLCVGTSIPISISTLPPANSKWYWRLMPAGTVISLTDDVNFSYVFPANGDYTLNANLRDECGSVSAESVTKTISIDNPLAVTSAITTTPETFCWRDNITLGVATTGTPRTYNWYFNGALAGTTTANSFPVNNFKYENKGNYTVSVSNNCNSATSSTAAYLKQRSDCPIKIISVIPNEDLNNLIKWNGTMTFNPGECISIFKNGTLLKDECDPALGMYADTSTNHLVQERYTIALKTATDLYKSDYHQPPVYNVLSSDKFITWTPYVIEDRPDYYPCYVILNAGNLPLDTICLPLTSFYYMATGAYTIKCVKIQE